MFSRQFSRYCYPLKKEIFFFCVSYFTIFKTLLKHDDSNQKKKNEAQPIYHPSSSISSRTEQKTDANFLPIVEFSFALETIMDTGKPPSGGGKHLLRINMKENYFVVVAKTTEENRSVQSLTPMSPCKGQTQTTRQCSTAKEGHILASYLTSLQIIGYPTACYTN